MIRLCLLLALALCSQQQEADRGLQIDSEDRFDDDPQALLPGYDDHNSVLALNALADVVNAPIDEIVDASWDLLQRNKHMGNVCPFRRKVLSKASSFSSPLHPPFLPLAMPFYHCSCSKTKMSR